MDTLLMNKIMNDNQIINWTITNKIYEKQKNEKT